VSVPRRRCAEPTAFNSRVIKISLFCHELIGLICENHRHDLIIVGKLLC